MFRIITFAALVTAAAAANLGSLRLRGGAVRS
jgi:hypothetical protein